LRLAEAQMQASQAALKETEVRLAEARLELDRAVELLAEEVTSQAELDRAQAEFESLGARIERQRSEVEVGQRQVVLWQRQLEDLVIRSPFSGVIVSKNAQPGEMISPNSAGGGFTRTGIGTVVDMTSLEIEVDVNESYINRVAPGQKVVAVLDSYPDWQIPSYVIAIIPTADRQKATVEVRIGFDQLDPRILPDMGVKVAFQERGSNGSAGSEGSGDSPGSGSPAVVIPKFGLRDGTVGTKVLVVHDSKIEERAVTVAESEGSDEVFVLGGLAPGERLVVEGPADLAEGDRVEEINE
jgi:RND family efflux transporter MFP subunit